MKKYDFLNHPAELRIRVFGKTKEELFKNAAFAMADILNHNATRPVRQIRDRPERAEGRINANAAKKEVIKIKATDINTLLIDFLNEILAKSQINKCVYCVSVLRFKDLGGKKIFLEAEIIGQPIKHFDEDIKAATYQDVDIKPITRLTETKNQKLKTIEWQTNLVLDI